MNTALAYDYDDYDYYELINGEVYMMARPTVNHWQISHNIIDKFDNYLKGKRCRAFGEIDVYLSDDDNFIPDAMIVCNPDIVEEDGIHGVPDLVVEVLSPSTAKFDKIDKFLKYEKYGVKEYWIVDPKNKSVDVYLLKEGKFELAGTYQSLSDKEMSRWTDRQKAGIMTEIKVSLYDDFVVNVKDIFERVK